MATLWLHLERSTLARRNGEGGLYQDSRGFWTATVELPRGQDDKRRRKVIRRKSKVQALRELRALQAELKDNGDIATSTTTVEQWAWHWFNEILHGTVSPNTIRQRRNSLENHIIPFIGKKRMDKLTTQDVRNWYGALSELPANKKLRDKPRAEWGEDYKTLSQGTMLLAHTTLKLAIDAAVSEQKLSKNVVEIAGPPKGKYKGRSAEAQTAFSRDEVVRLFQYIATHKYAALISTYLLTGARRGEVLGLEADRVTSESIDLSWQVQRIAQRDLEAASEDYQVRPIGGDLYLARPKSSAGWRIIPSVEPLRSVLALHMQTVGEGMLFLRENGEPMSPDMITMMWPKIVAGAGIESKVTLHGIRHTVIDLLYDAGVPETTIQQIVGHSNIKMTRKYQTRVNQDQATKALEALGGFMSK